MASASAALSIWLITKRRALLAYHAQSVMPVAKEGIDEITPTVANSVGDIAGSVAEGISRGVKKARNKTNTPFKISPTGDIFYS